MDTTKTSMDNFLQILPSLSASHEKALKQGIYNAVALFLLCLVCSAGYGLYIVLSPFLRPLVWALLCGAVLFPIKSSLTTIVHLWFDTTKESHKPFLISVSLIPINVFDTTSELIGLTLDNHKFYICIAVLAFSVLLVIYNYMPSILSYIMWKFVEILNSTLGIFISMCNVYLISIVLIGYISLLYMYWSPENGAKFRKISFGIWFLISLYISNALGGFPILTFCSLQILFLIGFIYEISLILQNPELQARKLPISDQIFIVIKHILTDDNISKLTNSGMQTLLEDEPLLEENEEAIINQYKEEQPKSLTTKPFLKTTGRSMTMFSNIGGEALYNHPTRRVQSASNVANRMSLGDLYLLKMLRPTQSLDIEENVHEADKWMYGAMYACLTMILWKHKWIVAILFIPLSYYYLKKFNSRFGISKLIINQFLLMLDPIKLWCQERGQALIPIPIRGLYKFSIFVDQQLTSSLKMFVDAMSTTAVIVALIIFVICATIFLSIQIYTEGVHVVKESGEILNSTLMNNPDIDWVPQQLEESVNSLLDNVYFYGRTAISNGIQKLVKDLDPIKAEHMEKKFLELWDRLYQAWMMSNDNPNMIGPTVDVDVAFSAWESLKEGIGKAPLQFFNMNIIQNFVKENIGTLMSLLDSIWSIVKGNISVVLGMVTELMYIVLIGGSALLNFVLNTVVFFSALFYLLNSSDKTYKPIEILSNFSPIRCHRSDEKGFAMTLQESVIGVFTTTFKLAAFYGMWTWFIHNLFQVKIIYLPTVFATLLAAVPFIDVTVACIPAIIELWFTQGALVALIFFLLQYFVLSWAITDFYMEMKGGGHPYLTGLSIAGGVLCLGIEGAIFGPLLLCCIMVAIKMSKKYLQSPTEEAKSMINSGIDKLKS